MREIRKKMGLTQIQFGRLLGFLNPNTMISNMENGKAPVTSQTERLCRYIEKYGILPEYVKEITEG
ncbi:MAG: helix-turn-helix domain-containing protein [Ignavibacteria bacterium]|nr:helix-turn-helix domain-containing protein [Ignavibacteria bacterium]